MERPHDDRVDADERCREPGAGHGDEGRVEPGRDRLREHRLAGAGRAEEEQATFAAKWSAWEPTGSDTAQARQIATRVAKAYRLENGQQLAAAIVSPPRITSVDGDVPVSTIAIRPDTSTGQREEGEFDVIPADRSLQFVLCGLGTGCSISSGVASEERQALLRREALELALYTFKYVDDIGSVSVFWPAPVRIDRVRLFTAPSFFRLPWLGQFDGYAFHRVILLRSDDVSDDLVPHELCHVWQMQHRPIRMPLSYLATGYGNNQYERQARAAATRGSDRRQSEPVA